MTKTYQLLLSAAVAVFTVQSNAIAAPQKKTVSTPSNSIADKGFTGEGITAIQPDPKHPGWRLWELHAKSLAAQSAGSGFEGILSQVSGVLYQKGTRSASVKAPLATANSTQGRLIASGGVTVISLIQPGTVLRSDRIIWNSKTNQIIAVGHVYYRNGKSGLVITGPQLIADTVLKTIRSSSGGRAVFPKGL